jgi:hypothetical protein
MCVNVKYEWNFLSKHLSLCEINTKNTTWPVVGTREQETQDQTQTRRDADRLSQETSLIIFIIFRINIRALSFQNIYSNI